MSKTNNPHTDQVVAVPSDEVSNLKPPVGKDGIQQRGLKIERRFTTPESDPFDEIVWEMRDAAIYDEKGAVIFEQKGVEVPTSWSQLATDIVSSKYFRKAGVPQVDQETSVRQLTRRVARTIRQVGEAFGGYFASAKDAESFEAELTHLLAYQYGAFNSPVWFNCGLWHEYGIEGGGGNYYWNMDAKNVQMTKNAYEHPQNSACFIQGVDDSLDTMLELQKSEVRLFKYGSGTGSNFSSVRAKGEPLSGGGASSGVLSFLEGFDRWAGSIKSGGTTRRAAKMVILDMDHPEIVDYIDWKLNEEKKAQILIAAGYSADFNGEAYHTISGQNSNNSVRIPDSFMNSYFEDGKWQTTYRMDGKSADEYDAKWLMDKIAYAAWACADPGVQFDDAIQRWHTCKSTGRINATNPCSEFVFLDDTACNLASLNLVKFMREDGEFDVEAYRHATRIFITAMEIIVDLSSYPTERIARRSHDFRPLGLGYANLGTFLMLNGIPYDSNEGRAWSGALSAILSGHGYQTSAEIAGNVGTFDCFEENRESMLEVMKLHRDAAYRIDKVGTQPNSNCPDYMLDAAREDWDICLQMGEQFGYRNSQISVIAPTGTIALLMDCDTTGIEPDFALVKFKKLAGGGYFKIINRSVAKALEHLGYNTEQIEEIIAYTIGTGTLEGASHINEETLKSKGFTEEDLVKIEAMLPSAFDLNLAFAPGLVDEACLKRLGINPEEVQDPEFNMLKCIGFRQEEIDAADEAICGNGTIEGAPHLKKKHYSIFDCANKCGKIGTRSIDPMGHVRMIAAVQPFISGAISKTVNLTNEASVDDIKQVYAEAWKLGVKCMSIYRDGSKSSQPLSSTSQAETVEEELEIHDTLQPIRKRLPDERQSVTHKFSVAGHDGYITVGFYDDGSPGEVFLTMSKEGSVISGLIDTIATMTSILLQYGVPLESLVDKFSHVRFEPSGFTSNKEIPIAKSIIDYVFRWLGQKFLSQTQVDTEVQETFGNQLESAQLSSYEENQGDSDDVSRVISSEGQLELRKKQVAQMQSDAPPCQACGSIMVRNGTCYRCLNCGTTSGCS
ncbi:TPA: vitamin B12-dependent ribonucleotide reductase [Candidatus Poribacteria bacterium]|nr:vitamin B12-dependent ribonucleotide reductase [Candidatus Poribacteria bacterium]